VCEPLFQAGFRQPAAPGVSRGHFRGKTVQVSRVLAFRVRKRGLVGLW
jgi:hypothetical protein